MRSKDIRRSSAIKMRYWLMHRQKQTASEKAIGIFLIAKLYLRLEMALAQGKVFHYVTGKFDLHQRVYAMTDFKIVSGKYFYYYFLISFMIVSCE